MASVMEQAVNAEAAALQNAQAAAAVASLTKMYVAGQNDPVSSVAGSSTGVTPADPVSGSSDTSSASPDVNSLTLALQNAQAAMAAKDQTIAQLRASIDSLTGQQSAKLAAMHALVDQLESQFDVVASAPPVDTSGSASGSDSSGSDSSVSAPAATSGSGAPAASQDPSVPVVAPVVDNQPIAPPQS